MHSIFACLPASAARLYSTAWVIRRAVRCLVGCYVSTTSVRHHQVYRSFFDGRACRSELNRSPSSTLLFNRRPSVVGVEVKERDQTLSSLASEWRQGNFHHPSMIADVLSFTAQDVTMSTDVA